MGSGHTAATSSSVFSNSSSQLPSGVHSATGDLSPRLDETLEKIIDVPPEDMDLLYSIHSLDNRIARERLALDSKNRFKSVVDRPLLVVDTGTQNETMEAWFQGVCTYKFLGITRKQIQLAYSDVARFFQNSDIEFHVIKYCVNNPWYEILKALLEASHEIASGLTEGRIVMLQNGGPDHAEVDTIISSLVQLMVDSYYYTIKGFCYLVDKEWFCYGLVCPQGYDSWYTFHAFLHCVVEMMSQQPDMFEFNEQFIIFLEENIYFPPPKNTIGNHHFPAPLLKDIRKNVAIFSNPLYNGKERTQPLRILATGRMEPSPFALIVQERQGIAPSRKKILTRATIREEDEDLEKSESQASEDEVEKKRSNGRRI